MSTKPKDPPENSPPPAPQDSDADDSGAFGAVPEELLPILPLLKKSVVHMRESNGFVKTTNKELIQLNKSLHKQNRLLWFGVLVGIFLVAGLVFALYEQRGLRRQLDTSAKTQADNVRRMNDVVTKLDAAKQVAEDTKKAVDEKPTITVKTDTSGTPTSVVVAQPAPSEIKETAPPSTQKTTKKGDPPPPAGHRKRPPDLEFPLGPPKKE